MNVVHVSCPNNPEFCAVDLAAQNAREDQPRNAAQTVNTWQNHGLSPAAMLARQDQPRNAAQVDPACAAGHPPLGVAAHPAQILGGAPLRHV
jgi:hypothetical protein